MKKKDAADRNDIKTDMFCFCEKVKPKQMLVRTVYRRPSYLVYILMIILGMVLHWGGNYIISLF